jgi:hypothetical protein
MASALRSAPSPDLGALLLLGALALAAALRPLVVALVALVLTLAGWRPARPVSAPVSAPAAPMAAPAAPMAAPASPLVAAPVRARARLTVAQLRTMARAAGLPSALARSGRRADLLAALAPL